MKKLKVNSLKSMIKKIVQEQQSYVPKPNTASGTGSANLLQQALGSLKDYEKTREEIKAELASNPNDRALKIALGEINAAIISGKNVVKQLSSKMNSGALNEQVEPVTQGDDESFESIQARHMEEHYIEELKMTIENDGDVSDPDQRQGNKLGRFYDAVLNNLSKKAAKGLYDPSKAVLLWLRFVDEYAAAYAKMFDMTPTRGKTGSKTWLSKSARVEVAKWLEEKERGKLSAGKKSSGVAEQAYAAPSIATEQEKPEVGSTEVSSGSSNGQLLAKVLDMLKKQNSDFNWKPAPDGYSAEMFYMGKLLGTVSRRTSRWCIKHDKLTYLVKNVEELKNWIVEEINSRGMDLMESRPQNLASPRDEFENDYGGTVSPGGNWSEETPLDRIISQEEGELFRLPWEDDENLDAAGDDDLEDDFDDVVDDDYSDYVDEQAVVPTTLQVEQPREDDEFDFGADFNDGEVPVNVHQGPDNFVSLDDLREPEDPEKLTADDWKDITSETKEVCECNDEAPVEEALGAKGLLPMTSAQMVGSVKDALRWVSNDDPNSVHGFEQWVRREVREAEGRGATLDKDQYAEIAQSFIAEMTDESPEYSQMSSEEQEAAGMTRLEAYPFQKMDPVELGKAIVELCTRGVH